MKIGIGNVVPAAGDVDIVTEGPKPANEVIGGLDGIEAVEEGRAQIALGDDSR